MPLDAFTLRGLTAELAERCVDTKIDKVTQPTRDEIILNLRGRNGGGRLLLSAGSGSPRACLTAEARENPAVPPMFCMLLRKLIGGGIIRRVTQPSAERMLAFEIEAMDELGELRTLRLVLELITRRANLVLVDQEGRIIDCIRRVEGDLAEGKRQVLPGLFYRPPEAREGIDPFAASPEEIEAAVASFVPGADLTEEILKTFRGFAPLVCRELAFRYPDGGAALSGAICALREGEQLAPWLILKDGVPKDFSALEPTQYGEGWSWERMESYSQLMERFFSTRDREERVRAAARDMTRTISNAKDRATR